MEHLPDPLTVLVELCRVLKPGGLILYTGPLSYEEHEVPHDYFRFTQFALRMMFARAGLEILELRWLAGYFATFAHQLKRMRRDLPRHRAPYGRGATGFAFYAAARFFRTLARPLEKFASDADMSERYTDTGSPLNYLVVARKPSSGSTPAS
jgi:SAM-dependent methyltransferase